jgi:PAS domain S-box-containing protein
VRPARNDDPFRTLVESVSHYAILLLDPAGVVQSWNLGAQAIKGYTPDEIIGRSFEAFYTREDLERGHPRQLLDEACRLGRIEEEGWRVRKDGSKFWADVTITALRDEAGTLTGFAKVTRDLSERRQEEEERKRRADELLRSEERFRLLVDSVEDYAIFMLDPDGYVTTWNSGAERIKGYRADEIVGQHFSRFRTEEDVRAGRCEEELEAAIRDGRLEEEGWRVRKDGSRFWANVFLTAIRNDCDELLGFAKVTRDLTSRLELEQEQAQRARAEEAVRLRDEFLSIASHELKTPLTAADIELHALRGQSAALGERMTRRIERASRNIKRLENLIDSLLDVSRIATGRLSLQPEEFDLREGIEQVVDSMRSTAARADCDLSVDLPDPIQGSWDRLRIEQVIMNLLSNALKYAAGAPVEVRAYQEGVMAIIEISDRGPGIATEDMDRIFGRFERAASMRHYGGLGLGLYVSRQIVEAQGGTIEAHNRPGGGATFAVRLPLAAHNTTETFIEMRRA